MIEFQHVSFAYEKNKEVLHDMSFRIDKGESVGLIGANGAGKSTTFKAMLGLVIPESGEIIIDGVNIKKFKSRDKEKIGCVLTDSFFPDIIRVKELKSIL